MKKIKLSGKLSLNKETIARLNQQQMGAMVGGAGSLMALCDSDPANGSMEDALCVAQSWDGFCNISQDGFCQSNQEMKCARNGSWNHQSCSGVPCGGTFQTGGIYCCV